MSHTVDRGAGAPSRERLMDAALVVFAGKGGVDASVKEIARVAGVTPGLLYHYFDSKDSLVTAILRERGFLPQLHQLLEGAARRPAAEVLPTLVRDYQTMLAENGQLVALFFGASRSHPDVRAALVRFVVEGRDRLADYLQSRVETGELIEHDTRAAGTALFGTIALGQAAGVPVDGECLVEIMLNGLRPRTERIDQD